MLSLIKAAHRGQLWNYLNIRCNAPFFTCPEIL
ncbi:unnamed protein product, partial [Hermetia illucens]